MSVSVSVNRFHDMTPGARIKVPWKTMAILHIFCAIHSRVLLEPSFLMVMCRPVPTPGIYSLDSPVRALLFDGGVQAPPHPQVFTHLTVLLEPSFLIVVYRPLPTPQVFTHLTVLSDPSFLMVVYRPLPTPGIYSLDSPVRPLLLDGDVQAPPYLRYLLTWQSCQTPPSWWWCTGPSPPQVFTHLTVLSDPSFLMVV